MTEMKNSIRLRSGMGVGRGELFYIAGRFENKTTTLAPFVYT